MHMQVDADALGLHRVWQTQHINYGVSVVDDTVAILLGLVYCVIAPIITPIALAYFLICSLLYKYNAVYVFSPRFQSGGHVRLFSICSSCLLCCSHLASMVTHLCRYVCSV